MVVQPWVDIRQASITEKRNSVRGAALVRNRTSGRGFIGWEALGGDVGRREQTILVVEDEASVRLAISDHLTDQGFTVHQAAGAAGAMDVIALHPEIDVVFTDLAMPGDLD